MENDMEAQREKRPLKHLQGLKGRVQNSLSGFFRACIVAALVMLQFAILIVLPFLLRQYASLFYLVMEYRVKVLLISIILCRHRQND